jgi:hypothetical protein
MGNRVIINDSGEKELFTASNPATLKADDKSVSTTSGVKSSSGDNTLIPAPGAGKRIVITFLMIQNKSSSAVTMKLEWSGGDQIREMLAQNQGDGLANEPAPDARLMATNQSLILNLSAAEDCTYSIDYYIEDV